MTRARATGWPHRASAAPTPRPARRWSARWRPRRTRCRAGCAAAARRRSPRGMERHLLQRVPAAAARAAAARLRRGGAAAARRRSSRRLRQSSHVPTQPQQFCCSTRARQRACRHALGAARACAALTWRRVPAASGAAAPLASDARSCRWSIPRAPPGSVLLRAAAAMDSFREAASRRVRTLAGHIAPDAGAAPALARSVTAASSPYASATGVPTSYARVRRGAQRTAASCTSCLARRCTGRCLASRRSGPPWRWRRGS